MTFKPHRLAVIVWLGNGKAYQVNLSNLECGCITSLLSQLHNGVVKVFPNALSLSLTRPKKAKRNKTVDAK